MIRSLIYRIGFIALLVGNFSCQVSRYLKEGEHFYTESRIVFQDDSTNIKSNEISPELKALSRPTPNTGLLRLGVHIHYLVGKTKKDRGFRHWLKYKVGRAPALYNEQKLERSRLLMENYLEGKGFFNAEVTVDTVQNRYEEIIGVFSVVTEEAHSIGKIYLPQEDGAAERVIRTEHPRSVLKSGEQYNKKNLSLERERITNIFKNQGFYNFEQQNLYFIVDTSRASGEADIHIQLKTDSTSTPLALKRSRIAETFIYSDYDLNKTGEDIDTVITIENYKVIRSTNFVKPITLDRVILQKEGDYFSKEKQNITINHLLDLGVYKFVNLKFERNSEGNLDRFLYLTPYDSREFTADLEFTARTGNFFGSGIGFTFIHRNLFRGAERFDMSVKLGGETQLGTTPFFSTANASINTELTIPRLIVPFKLRDTKGRFVPKTKIQLGNNFQRQIQNVTANSVNLAFGYDWRENIRKQHVLYPVSLNLVQTFDETPAFNEQLKNDERLRLAYENQFLAGMKYTFFYNSLRRGVKGDLLTFKGDLEMSGNFIHFFNNPIGFSPDKVTKISGLSLAQFTRVIAELRKKWVLQKNALVARAIVGIGVSYGNSSALPFSKQLAVGGASSLRGFRLREVGPGAYLRPSFIEDNLFLDQTGDLLLEMNLEYRFPIVSYFKGAAFTDIGNVWLLQSETRTDGVFEIGEFYKQIAITSGLGLRIDFEIALLRLDAAFPVRRPFYDGSFIWTPAKRDFYSISWFVRNLNYSFTIGYPF